MARHLETPGRVGISETEGDSLLLDTLTDWNPANTIAHHAAWHTQFLTVKKVSTILRQAEVLNAVCRRLNPTVVYTLLHIHADEAEPRAAQMQRMAIIKTATQLT